MRNIVLAALFSISVAHANELPDISGKWRATRYLRWGIRNEKVVKIADLTLRPENFGYLLFNTKQILEVVIDKHVVPADPAEQKANRALKTTEMMGSITSNGDILDQACAKVPYLKTHVACAYKAGSKIPLKFSMVSFDSPSFDENRKLVDDRFLKNGLKDIQATVTTVNPNGETGGTLILFAGTRHLLLNVTYYARPVTVEQAQSMKCPPGNECTATALLFDRIH